ncbi:CRISPR-associated endonuclease Cas2 [Streptococcus equi subsp. zooepidemicus]|uniref:CRISPR-associated endoribonuclease Cas2 n=1 Tax=Streptococcus equi subsp. zooepidemicus TaxID=40041 RepID=A0A7Z9D305_STRSZ|nr:CRISPR-associated endonuclease Cas2 [Streptococcus equi]MCD3398533.1 CRISPR-associated endonuclease Cas2 [Streptococcus equi subsp. zooepidemicus]VEF07956.1 CRISPR-associated protein Cas2 [Streptococcus equi subsp. zooepidemicus]HEK9097924.1 CRISPR-associated endonuclease Cas2 [Streptococcus equi subsp. zooepidemicus]HEL0600538.1 CRISPR-associated endonuclease Cas2 [Streptococcus equi subsp. zooepidemicus]HEL0634461.1 CRISPR-associated endonuclease Cas2 [Streptococcus equi subsp. zooepidemi
MMVLVTYDVNTETAAGRKRLRQVAKLCVDYGQRVQHSVFECSVTPAEFVEIKHKLTTIIDTEVDSIRFYLLGKHWQNRVETLGRSDSYDPDIGVLLL